jgi:hypothetical protein
MANSRFYSNTAQQTTLSGSISAGALTITVVATTGFPGSFPYTLALDYGAATEELVSVTAAAGANLTVTRAYGGTSAQSHSLGAVVRHVYDSTDATDFRTHEAATAAVHGVTGTLVGTSDTQTLANKTLTSPTVNGAALSGTLSGNPTFSGAPTFSGTPTVSGALTSSGGTLAGTWGGTPTLSGNLTFSGNPQITGLMQHVRTPSTAEAWEIYLSGDANPTLKARTNGTLLWGPGGASGVDTNLYRTGSAALKTDGTFTIAGAGGLLVGADTNLYRSAADTLKTDDSLQVAGGLTVTGNATAGNLTAWQTYTPTWSGLTSAGSGFASTGRYCRIGNVIHVSAQLTAGTSPSLGTGTITVSLPVTASSTPTGNFGWQGLGRHNPNDGSTFKTLIPQVDPGDTTATVFGLRQSDAGWTTPGTAGFIWIAGSNMRVEFAYEV